MSLATKKKNKENTKRANMLRQLSFKNGLLKTIKKDVKAGK